MFHPTQYRSFQRQPFQAKLLIHIITEKIV